MRYRVVGRVQGVGFRYHVVRAAKSAGITGIVRNEPDGTVVAEAEGDTAALARFEEILRQGPPGARVDSVRSDKIALLESSDFRIVF